MSDRALLLGLFFSNEDNLVYENIKYSHEISKENVDQLKILSFKFLGPVFLAAADLEKEQWKIEAIESSLSLQKNTQYDVIQSFFGLNSVIQTEKGVTNLFTFIGSSYTEDIKMIQAELEQYIHPSIIEDRYINKASTKQVKDDLIIKSELNRGINLIEYSLGAARKMYWEEQTKYSCIGVIERFFTTEVTNSYLYTYGKSTIEPYLDSIPSFYIMSILPNYYENLINETLKVFEKKGIYSNIRQIRLSSGQKKVLYLEEYLIINNQKRSYGAILIPTDSKEKNCESSAYFKKKLREVLDSNKVLEDVLASIDPRFDLKKWGANSEQELNEIKFILDKKQ